MPDLLNTIFECYPANTILSGCDAGTMTQFILDCTSLNLPNSMRFNINDPNTVKIFNITRDLCFAAHSSRVRGLKVV